MSLRIVNLGLPKSGTTTLAEALRQAGLTVADHRFGRRDLPAPVLRRMFVAEALSVIIQVCSFRMTGRRVFKMAPLHHHFELQGWSEPKIMTRFLVVAVIFALFSLTTLKLR